MLQSAALGTLTHRKGNPAGEPAFNSCRPEKPGHGLCQMHNVLNCMMMLGCAYHPNRLALGGIHQAWEF